MNLIKFTSDLILFFNILSSFLIDSEMYQNLVRKVIMLITDFGTLSFI